MVREHCRFNDGFICTKNGKFNCADCKDYISKYTRTDCKHYKSERKKATDRCALLIDCKCGDVPCGNPRIKKNGAPVRCTFYDKSCLVRDNESK